METSGKLNFQDLAELLAQKTSVSKKEAESFLREFFTTIPESITEKEPVKVKNFGTFKLTCIQARESIDVNTGEKIEIPVHFRLGFAPAPALKELVNKPFSHFENVLLNEGISFEGVEESMSDENEDDDAQEEIPEDAPLIPVAKGLPTDEPDENIAETEVVDAVTLEESNATVDDNARPESAPPAPIVPSATDAPIRNELNGDRKKTHSKRKRKKNAKGIILSASIVLATLGVILLIAIALNKTNKNGEFFGAPSAKDERPGAITENNPAALAPTLAENETAKAVAPDTVTLTAGKTLRLIALEKFGSREFWIYLYLKNKDRIKNPDVIPVGTKLLLPDKAEYNMESGDPECVAAAKKLGEEEMKKFW